MLLIQVPLIEAGDVVMVNRKEWFDGVGRTLLTELSVEGLYIVDGVKQTDPFYAVIHLYGDLPNVWYDSSWFDIATETHALQ